MLQTCATLWSDQYFVSYSVCVRYVSLSNYIFLIIGHCLIQSTSSFCSKPSQSFISSHQFSDHCTFSPLFIVNLHIDLIILFHFSPTLLHDLLVRTCCRILYYNIVSFIRVKSNITAILNFYCQKLTYKIDCTRGCTICL